MHHVVQLSPIKVKVSFYSSLVRQMLFRGGTTTAIIVIFPIEVSQKFTGQHVGRAYLGGAVNLHFGNNFIVLCSGTCLSIYNAA